MVPGQVGKSTGNNGMKNVMNTGRSVKNFGKNDEKNVSNGITSSMMVLIWPLTRITLQWIW